MSVVRVGSTKKFAENWDGIFGGPKSKKKAASTATVKKKPQKKKGGRKQRGAKTG